MASAHVAALDRQADPRRDYVVGGENAPQRAIFDYLARTRGLPPPVANALLRRHGRCRVVEEARGRRSFIGSRSLTRGVVEIFRHDWSLESNLAREELGLTTTALENGLERTLASLR